MRNRPTEKSNHSSRSETVDENCDSSLMVTRTEQKKSLKTSQTTPLKIKIITIAVTLKRTFL